MKNVILVIVSKGLSIDEFKLVFEKILGINNAERQIERLFKKIDTSADGLIDWASQTRESEE